METLQRGQLSVSDFINSVTPDKKTQEELFEYISSHLSFAGLEMPDQINPDEVVVKKAKIRPSFKLDDHFEIFVHGGEDLIERGVDESRGMNFVKLLYKESK